jgi:alkylhydroperoxidase family enzyme
VCKVSLEQAALPAIAPSIYVSAVLDKEIQKTMQTMQPIQLEDVTGLTRQLLDDVRDERGDISNMLKTMAQSPLTLAGYLQFIRALNGSNVGPKIRELIALTVAQANLSEYSLAQHALLAFELGLTKNEILEGRQARASVKTDTALKFARSLLTRADDWSTDDLRDVGFNDAEIVEIIAQVALSAFENYFNLAVKTTLDFPKVGLKAA